MLVLIGLYALLQSPGSTGVQPFVSEGALTAALNVAAAREHDGNASDGEKEGTGHRDGAAARARDRADGIAAAKTAGAKTTAAASTASQAATAPATAPVPGTAAAAAPPATGWTGGAGALRWAPPVGYAGYPITKVSAAGSLNTVDAGGGDVSIRLDPTHAVGPVVIKNCRNAVLIGGRIDVLPTSQVGGQDQRGIYVSGCSGVVHIEGVQINGAVPGSEADGIAVNAPKALVQIQNVRVDGMRGGMSSNHADVFQPWGGVREYRIDRLTGSTNYQGLHVRVGLGPIGRGTITNTNIASSEVGPVDKGGNFIWLDCNAYPLTLDNVYIAGRSGRSFDTSIWPTPNTSGCPATVSAGVASWPGYTSLSGTVRDGRPSSGDFVPAGSVGLGYASPGYR
jgi:hypothetical protein